MPANLTRRLFLQIAGQTLLGLLLPAVATLAAGSEPGKKLDWRQVWQDQEWGYVIDVSRCIGCARCVLACKLENGVPVHEPVFRTWVERYVEKPDGHFEIDSPNGGLAFERGDESQGKQFFVPKLCNQCRHAPCTQVCPVGATYTTGDGVVLVDRQRCVGCRYCIQACPYGARFFHPVLKVVDKCTWCYHRIQRGLKPACVQLCPRQARIFGNLKEPGNPVSQLLMTNTWRVLKKDMGTEPGVYYLELEEVVG